MPRHTLPEIVIRTPIPVDQEGARLNQNRGLSGWLQTLPTTIQVQVTLDFPDTPAQTSSALIVSVPGALRGDFVGVGPYPEAILDNSLYSAEVTAPDEVTVRFHNYSAASQDPDEALFTLYIFHQ